MVKIHYSMKVSETGIENACNLVPTASSMIACIPNNGLTTILTFLLQGLAVSDGGK